MAGEQETSASDVLNGQAQGRLRAIVERIERIEADRKDLSEDLKEVYAEAKGNGFDTKVLRKIIARRKKDAAKLQEEEAIEDLYLSALGDLPLFSGR